MVINAVTEIKKCRLSTLLMQCHMHMLTIRHFMTVTSLNKKPSYC